MEGRRLRRRRGGVRRKSEPRGGPLHSASTSPLPCFLRLTVLMKDHGQPTGDADKVCHERYHSGIDDASGREFQLTGSDMDPVPAPQVSR